MMINHRRRSFARCPLRAPSKESLTYSSFLMNIMRRHIARTDGRMGFSPRAFTPAVPPAGEDFSTSLESVQESFQAWLQGMSAGAQGQSPVRALTPGEITAVSLATVRESCKHRRWPREIVERFLAAEIVTRPRASHAASSEVNGAPRRFDFLQISGQGYATIVNMLRR
jgi:hypothetical protein